MGKKSWRYFVLVARLSVENIRAGLRTANWARMCSKETRNAPTNHPPAGGNEGTGNSWDRGALDLELPGKNLIAGVGGPENARTRKKKKLGSIAKLDRTRGQDKFGEKLRNTKNLDKTL